MGAVQLLVLDEAPTNIERITATPLEEDIEQLLQSTTHSSGTSGDACNPNSATAAKNLPLNTLAKALWLNK